MSAGRSPTSHQSSSGVSVALTIRVYVRSVSLASRGAKYKGVFNADGNTAILRRY